MSIASTVAALERANAAYKAAQAAATPVAKRGMFAMVERRNRYSSLLSGAYAGYVGYTPCLVSSVTRDGIVKEVRLAGQSWTLKRRDWERVMVDTPGKRASFRNASLRASPGRARKAPGAGGRPAAKLSAEREAAVWACLAAGTSIRKTARLVVGIGNATVAKIARRCEPVSW